MDRVYVRSKLFNLSGYPQKQLSPLGWHISTRNVISHIPLEVEELTL